MQKRKIIAGIGFVLIGAWYFHFISIRKITGVEEESKKPLLSAEQITNLKNQLTNFGLKVGQLTYDKIVSGLSTQRIAVEVKQTPDLSKNEKDYLKNRLEKVHLEQSKFYINLDKVIGKDEVLRIGLVFSGGGYRAMTLTSGYLKALEDEGILDASLYVSTLSGSTWFLGPWILLGNTVGEFKENLKDKIDNLDPHFTTFNIQNPKNPPNVLQFGQGVIWPKFVFQQPIRSVDFYGGLLANSLLSAAGDKRFQQRLSDQWGKVSNGNKPFPIYTAVSGYKDNDDNFSYNWYEFNPNEVRDIELNLTVDSEMFGREFENGKSQDFAPEQPFGTLMGVFGSAYGVNVADIKRIFLGEIDEEEKSQLSYIEKLRLEVEKEMINALTKSFMESDFGKYFSTIAGNVQKSLGDINLETARFSPGQFNNPWKGGSFSGVSDWLTKPDHTYLTLVDAGIDFNIPIPPLLRKERDLDVIIVGDSSGNVTAESAEEMDKFVQYARKKGYMYRVRSISKISRVYQDISDNNGPLIIYVNFVKDSELIAKAIKENPALGTIAEKNNLIDFDEQACLSKGACGTFNFAYTQEDFDQISGIAEFNMRASMELIHKEFDKILNEKRKKLGIETEIEEADPDDFSFE